VRRVTGGGADKVIVSVGETAVAQAAFSLVNAGGAINLFAGVTRGEAIALEANRIHYDEIAVVGSFGFGPEHFWRALELIARRQVNVSALVTATVPLGGAMEALKAAAHQQGIKTVVVFEGGGAIAQQDISLQLAALS
jgi:L-iditol 2-dehydrogenase